jgi:HD-GYP domain-containing protein (c-di-GMP phosphodiesterase class II)/DNA-binding CsgD family transcriptional regulator
MAHSSAPPLRLAELVGSLSLATDMGNGQPLETALRFTLVALELAGEVDATPLEREAVYWAGLLRFAGCTATSLEEAWADGDDLNLRAALLGADFGDQPDLGRRLSEGMAPEGMQRFLGAIADLAPRALPAHCEVAMSLARRLEMPPLVVETLDNYHERFDGAGPWGRKGDEIPLPSRLLTLAQAAVSNAGSLEPGEVRALVRGRAGRHLDPELVDAFLAKPRRLPSSDISVWDEAMEAEPGIQRIIEPSRLTELASVLGDHSDLKSPYTLGHARGVARLAAAAGRSLGLDDARVAKLEQAALLHDVGRAGVPNGILDKPGPLNAIERERARSHAFETERILSIAPALAPIARLAASNHERLDGSGYPRGLSGSALDIETRVLAAAEAFQGLTEERAYRNALSPGEAADKLRDEVKAGRMDARAVDAVIEGATGARPARRASHEWPAGLSDREVEVLRLVSRGLTNREIADQLVISPRTVQQHTIHIYDKCGVSTRAAATLFAAEHELFSVLSR